MEFEERQLTFITAPHDVHIRVLAPPGSGKTAVVIARIKYLDHLGIDLSQVMVTMFNKKAALEVIERLDTYHMSSRPRVRNYHALGYKLCDALTKMKLLPAYRLWTDEVKIRQVAQQALTAAQKETRFTECNPMDREVMTSFMGFIDLCKSDALTPSAHFSRKEYHQDFTPFIQGFVNFEALRKDKGFRTFNDLIYEPAIIISANSYAQKMLSNKLSHIIIDEYQDINPITQQLVMGLGGETAIFTAVGDDDQTINEFRGARATFLTSEFERSYPGAQTHILKYTFRFGHAAALCAYNLISNNKHRAPKICIAHSSASPTRVSVGYYEKDLSVPYADSKQHSLINTIKDSLKNGFTYKDIFILARIYSVTPYIEIALIANSIPYTLEGELPVYERYPFKSLMALLSMHPLSYSEGSMKKSAFPLALRFGELPISNDVCNALYPIFVSKSPDWDKAAEAMASVSEFVRSRTLKRMAILHSLLRKSKSPSEFLDAYYTEHLKRCFPENLFNTSAQTIESLHLYLAFMQQSVTYPSFKAMIAGIHTAITKDADCRITIMSAHKAKGLTFPVVIIPACCESIFPSFGEDKNGDIESERRLFYVAITRATMHVHLICSFDETLKNAIDMGVPYAPSNHQPDVTSASRFVFEMNVSHSNLLADALHNETSQELPKSHSAGNYNNYLQTMNSFLRVPIYD